jgi:hypothetical protein
LRVTIDRFLRTSRFRPSIVSVVIRRSISQRPTPHPYFSSGFAHLRWDAVGGSLFLSNSGSLAIFAAIRLASSRVSSLAADLIGRSCPRLLLSPKEAAYLGGRQWNGSSRKHR